MEDTIRRRDALKVIQYEREKYRTHNLPDTTARKTLKDAMTVIEQLPAAAEHIWTPCSEKMPEACKSVLVTCEIRRSDGKRPRYVCEAEWIPKSCDEALDINWDSEVTEYDEEKDEYYPREGWYEVITNWDDYCLIGIADFVIAWMPLPEPWKGADDE